jgi:hypothetical protein
MTGGTRAIKILVIAAAIVSSLVLPAFGQSFKKGVPGDKPTEPRQRIDDKAYNAALERIPTPKQPYDPWGVARPSEPAKPPK